jgi:hypothetical protein
LSGLSTDEERHYKEVSGYVNPPFQCFGPIAENSLKAAYKNSPATGFHH